MSDFKNPYKLKYEQFRYGQLEQLEKKYKCPILDVLTHDAAVVKAGDNLKVLEILAISIKEQQVYFKTLELPYMARFLSDYGKTWWLDEGWETEGACSV